MNVLSEAEGKSRVVNQELDTWLRVSEHPILFG